MTKDEALKLALEALEHEADKGNDDAYKLERDAIKEALAQPEQEPVTWRYKIVDVFGRPAWTLKTPKSDTRVLESQPLYTTPPQRKPLTDEEKDKLANAWFSKDGDTDVAHRKAIALIEEVEAAHGIKEEA